LFARLVRLVSLEFELGWAETRDFIVRLALALAVALPAAVALIVALLVLFAGALAAFFHSPWQHLVVTGGVVALLALAALGWSAWRLTHLAWPKQTLDSMQETWGWLAAQLRSRLTSR
jgi:hypothetical protein